MTLAQQFLTDLDPNMRVKGSRDSLGTLGLWSGFGRRVVGNVTTQTTSLTDFRMLVLGSWLVQDADDPTAEFLVWEQLCGYARAIAGDTSFRGVTRVQRRRQEGAAVTVSGGRDGQILNNQAMYGVWGLYRATSWRCGLLNREPPTVPHAAAAVVESVYLPRLTPVWGSGLTQLRGWLRNGHQLRPGTADHQAKLAAIHDCIADPLEEPEQQLFRQTLVEGGAPVGDSAATVVRRQRELADHLVDLDGLGSPLSGLDRAHVLDLVEGSSDDLAEALRWIVACESVLLPATAIFADVSTQDGALLDDVVDRLEEHFDDVPSLLSADDRDRWQLVGSVAPSLVRTAPDPDGTGADRWLRIGDALHHKQLRVLVELLLAQNGAVSRDRGGARGWVVLGRNDRLQVSLVDRSWTSLPTGAELLGGWVNPYFLPNLRAMALAAEGPQ